MHEARYHEKNSFITLTYDNQNLPGIDIAPGGNLYYPHVQSFLKNLRQSIHRKSPNSKISFYCCGEYGSKNGRAHWHLIIFGYDFPDKTFWRNSKGNPIHRSAHLEQLWRHGNSEIGTVTDSSANYCASYVTKKVTGTKAKKEYYAGRKPEFSIRSKGLGKRFYEEFYTDMYPHDYIMQNEKKRTIPEYYDKLHAIAHPEEMAEIKRLRIEKGEARPHIAEERLVAREKIQIKQLKSKGPL